MGHGRNTDPVRGLVYVRNRQKTRRVNTRALQKIARRFLADLSPSGFEVGFYLVGEAEITRLNETYLRHKGSTDVITFDYAEPAERKRLHGEIFICVDEAVGQASRFRASWQSELLRYLVHGVLHLCGYDDQQASDRRKMKREEERLVSGLRRHFRVADLGLPRSRRLP
jgi:probable rRNA maturation factor